MKKKINLKMILIFLVIVLLLAVSLFPFYYMVVQSVTPWDAVDKTLIPKEITFRSYDYLLEKVGQQTL